ncbi:MAG: hypothetical protein V7K25_04815 [Nostoc sp.]|uniref:hypothetical protein n=1 Tax=Nostoc sp. TaxID=1180 RepID=UPI002FFCD38B
MKLPIKLYKLLAKRPVAENLFQVGEAVQGTCSLFVLSLSTLNLELLHLVVALILIVRILVDINVIDNFRASSIEFRYLAAFLPSCG